MQIIQTQEGHWSLQSSWSVRSTGKTLTCNYHLKWEWWALFWDRTVYLGELSLVSVRIELNCRTSCLCPENCLLGRKPPPHVGIGTRTYLTTYLGLQASLETIFFFFFWRMLYILRINSRQLCLSEYL